MMAKRNWLSHGPERWSRKPKGGPENQKVVQKSGPETRDAIIQLIADNANIALELTEYC